LREKEGESAKEDILAKRTYQQKLQEENLAKMH